MTEAEILATTYFDTCNIKRKTKTVDPFTGETKTEFVTVYENIKCALSKKDNQLLTSDGIGRLNYTHELFLCPNIDILPGDTVEITSNLNKAIYLASKPFQYSSHIEVFLNAKEGV